MIFTKAPSCSASLVDLGLGCPGNLRDALKHLGWASPYAMEDEDLMDALGLEERCWSLQDIYFFWLKKKHTLKTMVLFLHICSKIVLKHVLLCMSEERLIISTSV